MEAVSELYDTVLRILCFINIKIIIKNVCFFLECLVLKHVEGNLGIKSSYTIMLTAPSSSVVMVLSYKRCALQLICLISLWRRCVSV